MSFFHFAFAKKKPFVSSGSISQDYLKLLIGAAIPIIGHETIDQLWQKHAGMKFAFSISDGLPQIPPVLGENDIRLFSFELVGKIGKVFGRDLAENQLRMIFTKLRDRYDDSLLGTLFAVIPKEYLENERIKYLSREELQKLIAEKDELTKTLLRKEKELMAANEKLRALDQMKNEFISVAAHQLRTPLSGMKWTYKLLLDGDLGGLNGEQRTFLEKSADSNDRLIKLVNDMLNVDRLQSGSLEYSFSNVALPPLIEEILSDVVPLVKKKNQKLIFEKPPQIPAVHIDAQKMRAVIQNVLENAIKYTPAGGTITISLFAEPEHVVVSVKDTGIGIPETEKKYIFHRFFRASNAKQSVPDGSGLGLFFVRKIMDKHGGKIWFESKQNAGTTFHFTLPLGKVK